MKRRHVLTAEGRANIQRAMRAYHARKRRERLAGSPGAADNATPATPQQADTQAPPKPLTFDLGGTTCLVDVGTAKAIIQTLIRQL